MATNAKIVLGDNEPIEKALKRFKRLVEKAGVKKEAKLRQYYEKPSEARRREARKQQRNRRKGSGMDMPSTGKKPYGRNQTPTYYIAPPEQTPSES